MKFLELRRKMIRIDVEPIQKAIASQDVVRCTHFSPKPGEPRVVYRNRTFVAFGYHKQLPFIFDKKTQVS